MASIKDIFVGKKTRNSIYTADAIKNLLVKIACGKTKYNLTTKTGKKCFYNEVYHAMSKYFMLNIVNKNLKEFGIGSEESLATAFIENKEFLINECKLNLSGLVIESKFEKKAKAYIKKYGNGIVPPTDDNEAKLSDLERCVVVRTKYGTHDPLMYTIKGALTTEIADSVKAMYAYESGCNYYEARPILYTTWINLPDEYKNASRPCEEDDLKNVNE